MKRFLKKFWQKSMGKRLRERKVLYSDLDKTFTRALIGAMMLLERDSRREKIQVYIYETGLLGCVKVWEFVELMDFVEAFVKNNSIFKPMAPKIITSEKNIWGDVALTGGLMLHTIPKSEIEEMTEELDSRNIEATKNLMDARNFLKK